MYNYCQQIIHLFLERKMALPKNYWKRAHTVDLNEIENLHERAVMAKEAATHFFGGIKEFASRLDLNHRTLYNMRYKNLPLPESHAWTVESWNEGISFAYLRPDLAETEDDPVLGNDIPVKCQNCVYRWN